MPKNEPTIREVRCDDPAVETMNQLTGKDRGHLWIICEWEEIRSTPGGYTYTVSINGGSGGGYYPNAGGGGTNGQSYPETVTKRAKKLMCQYCLKVINAPV